MENCLDFMEKSRDSWRMPQLSFEGGGIRKLAPGSYVSLGCSDTFKVHFVESGEGFVYVDGTSVPISRASAFMAVPGREIRIQSGREELSYRWVEFIAEQDELMLRDAANVSLAGIIDCGDAEGVEHALFALSERRVGSGTGSPSERLRDHGILYQLVGALLCRTDEFRPAKRYGARIGNAVEFAQRNFDRGISVQDMAGRACLERKYFSRLFKARMGIGPKEYLLMLKIQKSKRLLRDATLSVKEVAALVGCDDSLAFSKTFSQAMGKSPTEYRRQLLGESQRRNIPSRGAWAAAIIQKEEIIAG